MRDVITLHIGQAGVQIGNAIWELFCVEHGISEDGTLMETVKNNRENKETFFFRTDANKFVPKCLFVDLEPSVIDEVRIGSYRDLYNPEKLITGPEDAASNFARGFFTVGKLLLETVSKEIRRVFESCDRVQAFMLFRSLGGGTGSGLTSALFDRLSEYPKTSKVEFPIFPSPALTMSTVEPYNSILAEHFCIEDIDVGLSFDNEALYDICVNFLNVHCPTFNNINRLLAPLTSSITASLRFDNILNCDLTLLTTNLVPYPRIHFPLCNFAPIIGEEKAYNERLNVSDLTRYVFERDNQMMKIDMSYGRYMSCVLFFRGAMSPKDVYNSLIEIKAKKSIQFVNWCPTGFKVGINSSIPKSVPNSRIAQTDQNVAMLTNSSAIGQAWQRLCHKFYLLYSKRSFLHWFVGEGMDECEFTEALFNISTLVKDYEEVSVDLGSAEEDVKIAQNQSKERSAPPSIKCSEDRSAAHSADRQPVPSPKPSTHQSSEHIETNVEDKAEPIVDITEPIQIESQVESHVEPPAEPEVEIEATGHVDSQVEDQVEDQAENGMDDPMNQNHVNDNSSFRKNKSISASTLNQNIRCISSSSH